mmetsp:Transcript_25556/g.63154  ORF Transcript_25556/g.63154 Transcript_25556/m.63154 type:complete len:126 (-) Transcript_25556:82-459(-)
MLRSLCALARGGLGAARWAAPVAERLQPLQQPMLVFRRALSDVPLLASESRVLRHMREVKEGLPLAHVRGSPFGGEVIIKRVDRFGRRRIKGKRGLSKRVIWAKQVVKQLYCNLRTKRLHKMVRV